jgi:subtilisin-like proprotein convertase family protein
LRSRRYQFERLEERCVMSADPLVSATMFASPPAQEPEMSGSGSALATAPFPLEETFLLNSRPGATKTIYLDFDGHLTRNTPWNTDFGLPNILTPAFDTNGDPTSFSNDELLLIQTIWERVVEDFRPFDVNVTTEDPGLEALRNTGNGDEQWGQRVVIGGDTYDWFTPVTGDEVGGVAHGSFNAAIDDPTFVFNVGEFVTAETISHEVGHTLGLAHDGQFRFWVDITDPMDPIYHTEEIEYYNGHGSFGPTNWGPIMGASFPYGGAPYSQARELTQWSIGEYANANNIEDDLEIISSNNGFGYIPDDHGNLAASATSILGDNFALVGEGIIERNDDVDFFSFTVSGLGEGIVLDVDPFYRGPNLDVLASLYHESDLTTPFATSNPVDDILAGSQSYGASGDGGWRVQFTGNGLIDFTPDVLAGTWQYTDVLFLPAGTYYLSVDGTGQPLSFVDPTMPPQLVDPPDPLDPLVDLAPDLSDWGYSDYGSLGYYSISGVRKTGLVVGVDFDQAGGNSPLNWTLYSGGSSNTTLSDLTSEIGDVTPYDLSISTTGTTITTTPSADPINSADLPNHALPLDDLGGYIGSSGETLSFVWSDLEPGAVYQVYVFGHSEVEARNVVTVSGGFWNGAPQVYNFTQNVSPDGLVINDEQSRVPPPVDNQLASQSLLVIADLSGQITIEVTNEAGFPIGLAGVAIAPTEFGSISGIKWNDKNANRTQDGPTDENDPDHEGNLEGFTIFLDLNNNGELDLLDTDDQEVTEVASVPVPLPIVDHVTTTSDLFFEEIGQIVDVEVTIDMSHTFPADIELTLVSPIGTRITLMNDRGGAGQLGSADDFGVLTFDDEAATAIDDIVAEGAPFSGSYRPMVPLSLLNGETSDGVWTLEIFDDANDHSGTLEGWSLTLTLAGVTVFLEPFRVTDAEGNYTFDDLLPGLYHVREHLTPEQVQAGWNATLAPPAVNLASGATFADINFGNWIPAVASGTISGQKWNDLNADGVKNVGDNGLAGWTIYLDADNNGVLDLNTTQLPPVASTNVGQTINDFATVTSTLNFSGPVSNIGDVDVTLDITHTFDSDLEVFLISPEGTEIELFTRVDGNGDNFTNTVLDDQAATSITAGSAPFTGSFRPEEPLSNLNGENPNGIWTLIVRDVISGDTGVLNGWSITIAGGERFTTTDASGNYLFEDVPAGSYIVREVQQPGWEQTADTTPGNKFWEAIVGTSTDPTGLDFGNHNPALSDDHANSAVGATPVTVPGSKVGRIGVPGDVDWFSFAATAGTTYVFEVELDSLSDSVLRLIGPNGTTQLALNDNAVGTESVIRWTAPATGTYFLEVKGAGSATGKYNVVLSFAPTDDHGDDATDNAPPPTPITSPSIVPGVLETLFDADWFSFTATAGTEYELGTILGTLEDSVLRIYDANGITELAFNDNADGLASFIRWVAPANGTYYAEVRAKDGVFEGTYFLSFTVDDHGDDATDASPATNPGSTPGNIELLGDVDWFSFTAVQGTHYLLEARATTLGNPQLRLVGTNGTTELAFNDDGPGLDDASLIQWTAPANGTYFLEVSDAGSGVGTYNVLITLDDHGSSPPVATVLNIVTMPTAAGNINVPGDADWFKFTAEAGRTYRIDGQLMGLVDPVLDLIHPDGETIIESDDDGGSGLSSLIFWTAPSSGDYYVRVTGFNPDTQSGTYGLAFASTAALLGDYNRDNIVNGADYVIWRKTNGQGGLTPFSGADGNGDGMVNQADFNIWKAHYGETLPPPGGEGGAGSGAVASTSEPEAPLDPPVSSAIEVQPVSAVDEVQPILEPVIVSSQPVISSTTSPAEKKTVETRSARFDDRLPATRRDEAHRRPKAERAVRHVASGHLQDDALVAWLSGLGRRKHDFDFGSRDGDAHDDSPRVAANVSDELDAVFDLIGTSAGFRRRAI